MIHLFHGDSEFEKSEAIAALRRGIGDDPSLWDLNCAVLDGRTMTMAALQHHCDTPPFLGEYRLAIVNDLPGKDDGSLETGWPVELIPYLPHLPETTHLVLNVNRALPARHRLLTAVAALGKQGDVRLFVLPALKGGELARWVERRAQGKGARLGPGVADDLATFIGPDLRRIDNELEKLALYTGGRAITREDVRRLVPYAQEAGIFAMVDALALRQTAQALRLLTQLHNEGAHPLYLLTMIVRQYRILLQVKGLMEQGLDRETIATRLGLHPFPTGKAMAQAQHYRFDQLVNIYDRLLATDVAIKTGQMEALLALNVLVVELARL
jgi:DNA polymerase-3 subunit delta